MLEGLAPIASANATVLILGSLPGAESLRLGRYYAHPRNHFWRLLAEVYGEPVGQEHEARRAWLQRRRIALWDVLEAAERTGSLDTSIRDGVANDIPAFLRAHPHIERTALNGGTAGALFQRHFVRSGRLDGHAVRVAVLPSTSPAHARPLAEKLVPWRRFLLGGAR